MRNFLLSEGRRRRRPPISQNFVGNSFISSFSTVSVDRDFIPRISRNRRRHEAPYTIGDWRHRIPLSENGRSNNLFWKSISSSNNKYRRDEGDLPMYDPSPQIRQFTDAMTHLYQEHLSLPPASHDWVRKRDRTFAKSEEKNTVETEEQLLERRQILCKDVDRLVSSIKLSVNQGSIRAMRGKDGYALMDSLGVAMLIYSEAQPTLGAKSTNDDSSGVSSSQYEACLGVFEILRNLNLPIMASHYACAIRAACRESRWKEAAKLFLGQIHGNATDNSDLFATGGLAPIDEALAWEGLYALAVDTMTEERKDGKVNESPSKRVFDTAMQMCMISPSNQKSCKTKKH